MPETSPVALVTGGAVRVGRAISLGLGEAGYDVLVHYRSSSGPAEEVRERLQGIGRRCVLASADLGASAAPDGLAQMLEREFGRLDLLVNSAASFESTHILETDAEEWNAILELNTRAPHLLVRALAPMLRRSGGSVVNIADHMGLRPWVRYGAHSVSKAALIHLSRIQARALAPEVRVNAVAPGLVLPPDHLSGEALREEVDATLLKRSGTPQDVVEAVLYLARASFVTGQLLVVDGGGTTLD